MKKFITLLYLLLFLSVSTNVFADSWMFVWNNVIVTVPVFSSIERYKDEPFAKLYRNSILLTDASITYSYEGDWLYFLSDVDTSKVGDYKVWYKAYDNKYRPGTCLGYKALVTFHVIDDTPPTVKLRSDQISLRRNSTFDPLDNCLFYDNYSSSCEAFVIQDANYKKVGDYVIKIAVNDESGNQTTIQYPLNIYENDFPSIFFIGRYNTISVEINQEINLGDYFTASDEIDGDLTSQIIYPEIKTDVAGVYEYQVEVVNKAYLKTIYEFTVKIIDSNVPQINLVNEEVVIDYASDFSLIDLNDYVSELMDNGINLDTSLITISGSISKKVGEYIITYSYSDGYNKAEERLIVKVLSTLAPNIIVSDITCKVGENLDLMSIIEVYDESDEMVKNSLIVYDQNIDYQSPGTYQVDCYAINSSGLESLKSFKVIVEKINNPSLLTPTPQGYVIYVLSGIVLLMAFCLVVMFVKMKRNKVV